MSNMSPLNNIIKSLSIVGFIIISATTSQVYAEIPSQAFSGLNHFIPTQARKAMYKYRAESNRSAAETEGLARANADQLGIVGDCSLNIGNVFTDENNFGGDISDNETIVFIDGDVINASNCGR